MKNGSGNGKAPALPADALWDAIEDSLLSGSIDAAAVLQRLTASGKPPVARKTKAKLRNQHRKVRGFDTALEVVALLRKLADAPPVAAESATTPASQLSLPLPANSNGSGAGNGALYA